MKNDPSESFNSFCRKIQRQHKRLGHKYGWRFLYTPKKTLSPKTKIVFIGLNPGGGKKEDPKPSVETGNAYRETVEPWANGELSPLQRQVSAFYALLSSAWPGTNVRTLMDGSLSANFIPFRSGNIANLNDTEGSLRFAKELWDDILDLIAPTVIVTMGSDVTRHLDQLLKSRDGVQIDDQPKCDWGNVRYRLASTILAGKKVLLIGLPHLSRFRIFGRKNDERTFAPLVKAMKQHLTK